jgi:hypothetical protein
MDRDLIAIDRRIGEPGIFGRPFAILLRSILDQ